VRFSNITFPLSKPRPELLDDLLVSLAEGGGLGRGRLGPPFDITDQVEEDLDRAPIRCGRAVNELLDDRLAHRDLPAAAILSDDDRLVQRFGQQGGQVLRPLWPAAGISGLALLEPGVARRLTVARLEAMFVVR
jgi:hypothetical protein